MRDAPIRTLIFLATAVLGACGPNTGTQGGSDSGTPAQGTDGSMASLDGGPGGGPSPNCPGDFTRIDAVLREQPTCILDSDCTLETLSCSVLGQCWAIVSPNYKSALDMDIEILSTDQCDYTGSCTCPPEPSASDLRCQRAQNAQSGVCIQVLPDGGVLDAGGT
jgi:hypothetical protein